MKNDSEIGELAEKTNIYEIEISGKHDAFNYGFLAGYQAAQQSPAAVGTATMKGEKEKLALRSLNALYLEVHHSIADDVRRNVLEAFAEIRQAPISGAATGMDIDWDELRDEFFKQHVNDGGVRKILTAPHDLFNWFKSKLSSLPSAQGQFSEQDMRNYARQKCKEQRKIIMTRLASKELLNHNYHDDILNAPEPTFDEYLHPLPESKP